MSESFAAKLKLNLLRPKAEVNDGDLFLVVGLGNPGREYQETRHNAGFMVIDRLAADAGASLTRVQHKALVAQATLEEKKVVLAKPQTYMNLSGEAVSGLARFYKIPPERILVVHDDLDLPYGMLRMRASGSSAGQKGMLSSIEALGTDLFTRIFIGIGRPVDSNSVIDHVLGCPEPEESSKITEACERAAYGILHLPEWGINRVMNELNGRN